MTEAFELGFVKAAMDNGIDPYTALELLKLANPTIPPEMAQSLSDIATTGGIMGGGAATGGATLGAPLGTLIGGGLGAGLGYLSGDEKTKWRNAAIGGGLGSIPGAAAGAFTGGVGGMTKAIPGIQQRMQLAIQGVK